MQNLEFAPFVQWRTENQDTWIIISPPLLFVWSLKVFFSSSFYSINFDSTFLPTILVPTTYPPTFLLYLHRYLSSTCFCILFEKLSLREAIVWCFPFLIFSSYLFLISFSLIFLSYLSLLQIFYYYQVLRIAWYVNPSVDRCCSTVN